MRKLHVCLAIVWVVFAFFSDAHAGEPTPGNVSLARKYLGRRPDLFQMQSMATRDPFASSEEGLDLYAAMILKSLKDAPNWNPEDPQWQRMNPVVRNDVRALYKSLSEDPEIKNQTRQMETAFTLGLAEHLEKQQLLDLIKYYSTPVARVFIQLHSKMRMDIAIGVMRLQAQSKDVSQNYQEPDANEVKLLAGLVREDPLMQLGALDDGPGSDQSGLQAILMFDSMGISSNFDVVEGLGKSLPVNQRESIVEWRQSELAKAERSAIYEAAKNIHHAVNLRQTSSGIVSRFESLLAKWQWDLNHE